MIPVKLNIKNFLSYGEEVPPLDFTQFHVACLSGDCDLKNGLCKVDCYCGSIHSGLLLSRNGYSWRYYYADLLEESIPSLAPNNRGCHALGLRQVSANHACR